MAQEFSSDGPVDQNALFVCHNLAVVEERGTTPCEECGRFPRIVTVANSGAKAIALGLAVMDGFEMLMDRQVIPPGKALSLGLNYGVITLQWCDAELVRPPTWWERFRALIGLPVTRTGEMGAISIPFMWNSVEDDDEDEAEPGFTSDPDWWKKGSPSYGDDEEE